MDLVKSLKNLAKYYFLYQSYDLTREQIIEQQHNFLLYTLYGNRDCAVGKYFQFDAIVDYQTYKKQVPVMEYDDYKHRIIQCVKGAGDIIVNGKIDWFAKTSGTTSDSFKYVPVTQDYMEHNHLMGGKHLFAQYLHRNPNSCITQGHCIVLGGPTGVNEYTGEQNVGYISSLIQQNNPKMIREFFTKPDEHISFDPNRESKIHAIITTYAREDITVTMGVTSWNLFLLKKLIEFHQVEYVDDIWPNYELFLTGGMNYKPYENQIRSLFRKSINIWQGYNSSEGFFGIQQENDSTIMKLLFYDVFYEFIPIDDYITGNYSAICSCEDIQPSIDYVLIITNSAGLYRYVLGDTIRFVDTTLFLFEFTGRTKSYLSLFGETTTLDHTDKVIQRVCDICGVHIVDYHVSSRTQGDGPGYHQWILEFDKATALGTDALAEIIDEELQKANIYYEGKRQRDLLMKKPEVVIVPSGTFHHRLSLKGKVGGQHKIPRLSNQNAFADELLAIVSS